MSFMFIYRILGCFWRVNRRGNHASSKSSVAQAQPKIWPIGWFNSYLKIKVFQIVKKFSKYAFRTMRLFKSLYIIQAMNIF